MKFHYRVCWYVIEPERRFSIDTVVNHPWITKNSSPLTKLIIDQILNIKDPRAGWLVNETTVDSIVRTVGVTRESVIDSVRKNKCDDISALYHMVSAIMSCEQSPQKCLHLQILPNTDYGRPVKA